MNAIYPDVRLRRLRRTPAMRELVGMAAPVPQKLLWPVFVVEGQGVRMPIDALLGQHRCSIDVLLKDLAPVVADGIGGVLIFGNVEGRYKDSTASYAYRDDGLVQRAVKAVRKRFDDLLVFTDVCLCGYTDHGHCGPLTDGGAVHNDAANRLLARIAVSHAAAGAHGVAPSAMMDGQVHAIRSALTTQCLHDTVVMSYSTKFASAMYGPFREAAGSTPSHGDRTTYQAPYNDPRQALRESRLDEAEGADILMVKPALCYLDILSRLRQATELPLAAYNVSGEYAMLYASAERGWGDLYGMAREVLTAIARAGADIIITYWANQYRSIMAADE